MHVALLNVNEPLFEASLGDDAEVLRELGQRTERLTVVVATRRRREAVQLAGNVELVPAFAPDRVRGLPAMTAALKHVHEQHPLDLIQAQECMYTGLAAAVARRAIGAKLTVGVFGSDPADPGFAHTSPGHRVAALLGRMILRRADLAQTDSRYTEVQLARRGINARYKPITPLNLATFMEVGADREHRTEARDLLYVGRLGRQKHVELLLEAVARLDGVRLQLIGDGPDRAALEALAARLGVPAQFVGHVPHGELAAAYARADLLAMSSRYEGFPRVFMEAGATGLPIVSTAVAGALELEPDAPIWIAPADPEGYAGVLASGLADVERRRRCGEALRAVMAARLEGPPPPDQQVAIWQELCHA